MMSGVDLMIATDDNIMYCNRKAIVVQSTLSHVFATIDGSKVSGSQRKERDHDDSRKTFLKNLNPGPGSRKSPRSMNVLNRAL